jgi:hypothetical protein
LVKSETMAAIALIELYLFHLPWSHHAIEHIFFSFFSCSPNRMRQITSCFGTSDGCSCCFLITHCHSIERQIFRMAFCNKEK